VPTRITRTAAPQSHFAESWESAFRKASIEGTSVFAQLGASHFRNGARLPIHNRRFALHDGHVNAAGGRSAEIASGSGSEPEDRDASAFLLVLASTTARRVAISCTGCSTSREGASGARLATVAAGTPGTVYSGGLSAARRTFSRWVAAI